MSDIESKHTPGGGLPLLGKSPVPPPPDDGEGTTAKDRAYKLHRRFDRLGRLFGDPAVERLMNTRVVVLGLGGVGGFAAEALVRSAVGRVTLVDFDDVCITNVNRQLQAMRGTVGKSKADVLKARLELINPQADIRVERVFYNAARSEKLLTAPWGDGRYDYVVDCIDNVTAKLHLLATCRARGLHVVSSMGAAGKLDPTRIRVSDLNHTQKCRLAREMRKRLRREYDLPKDGDSGITAVWSSEARTWPRELHYDGGEGFRCVCPHVSDEHSCDQRTLIDGTAVYVTGAFGFACASAVVNDVTRDLIDEAPPARSTKGTIAKEHRDKGAG